MSKHGEQIASALTGKVDGAILAAAFAKPRGSTLAQAGGGLIASEIGHARTRKQGAGAEAAGIELGNPGGVAITATDLITMEVKVSFTGSIKEVTKVLSVVPLSAIDSFTVKRMGMAGILEIGSGGGTFKLEGKAGDMREVEEAFAKAKAGQP